MRTNVRRIAGQRLPRSAGVLARMSVGRLRSAPPWRASWLLLAATCVNAAELPRAAPESVGMTSAGLDALRTELDAVVARGEFPGITAMVARRGQVVFAHAAGLLDVQTGAPARLDSLMRIYSMTKPVTSVAAMLLAEEGKLDLHAPVARFFPRWKNMTVLAADGETRAPAERPVTAHHLLTQTAGLAYGYDGDSPVDRMYREAGLIGDWDYLAHDTRELVTKLADIPLLFHPGARWHYGFSTDVLGHLVERVSGKPLDVFLRERVFAPLGIRDAYFDVPAEVLHRFGTDHIIAKDGTVTVQDNPREDPEFIGVTFLSGGGGLVTTVGDFMRFCLMLDGNGAFGGTRLLKAETVAAMIRNQLPDGVTMGGEAFGYGFGVFGDEAVEHQPSPGSYYWGGAAGTFFWIDPAERLVGVFLPQRINAPGRIQTKLQRLVYEAIDRAVP